MGDEKKPVGFLNRRGAPGAPVPPPAPEAPAAPVPPPTPDAPPPPQAPSAAPSQVLGIPSARMSGKFKVPGNKSILGTQPRMSAIRGSVSQVMTQGNNLSQSLGPAARSRTGVFNKAGGGPPSVAPTLKPALPSQAAIPAAAAAPGLDSARARAEQHLQRGLDHYDRGEFDQALDAYTDATNADPKFAMAYNNLGMVLIDLERYDEALNALFESIGRDANYAEAYNNLGFVLRRLSRDIDAAAAYKRFLAIEPDVEEAARINAWVESVRVENGLDEIPPLEIPEEAQATPPTAPAEPPKIKKMAAWEAAAGNMATAAPVNAVGEIGDAEPAPQKVPMPHLGTQRISIKREETAEEKNNRCIALIEKSLDEFEAGNIDEARKLAEQAVGLEDESSEAHTALGKVLVREEKLEEGIQHLERAMELDSLDPAPVYVLGFTLRAMERNVEAAEVYEKFLKLMPDAVDATKMRQWIQHIKGIAQAEVDDHEDDGFEDRAPILSEPDTLYKTVLDNFKTAAPAETIAACMQILEQAPEHARTRVLLGRAYLRIQDFDNAAAAFATAFEQDPNCSEALYFMGQCEEKRGDSPRALKLYRSYVENYPEGSRVEKLQAWFLSHGVAETGKGLSQQIQCEWCLRFFDEGEISLHENKATCNGCLALMGSTPIQNANTLETVDPADDRRLGGSGMGATIKRLVVFGGLSGVAALVALGFFTTTLDPLLIKFNLKKPAGSALAQVKPPPNGTVTPPIPDPGERDPIPGTKGPDEIKVLPTRTNLDFDNTKVKIVNAPERDFAVFTRWTWKPELEGVAVLDEKAPGWKKEYFFKDRPIGMTVENETGTVLWNASEMKDYEALKRGQKFNIELTIKGSWIGPEGARKDLFSVSKAFTVASQFGYELSGQELDVGLSNDARNVEFATLGGDAASRVMGVLQGSQNQGKASALFVGPDGPKRNVPLLEGARSAAACEFELTEPPQRGILVSNWKTGEVKLFINNQGTFAPAASAKFAPGTMALAAMEFEKGKISVAALSSAMGTLSLGTWTPAAGFSSIRNVQLVGGGGNSRLIAWKSEKKGPGFCAVMPLAEDPIRFVPMAAANEKDAEPVRSPLKDEGVITAALPLESTAGSRRLALVLGGKMSHLVLLQEKDGVFAAIGTKVQLGGPGLGAVAWDFNHDGCDDLFVTMRDETCFYFLGKDDTLAQGPTIANPGMLGPAALLDIRHNSRPDIAVLNENKKARIFKPIGNEPLAAKAVVGQAEKPSADK